MNREKMLLSLLMLHLFGLVIMAGTTFIDYITYRMFWRMYALEKKTSASLLTLMSKFRRIAGIGAALLILTGFGMMAVTRGVFGEQTWFRIKFAIVLLLVSNAIFIGRRLGMKQQKLASAPYFTLNTESTRVRNRIRIFYLLQFFFFIVIIFLSVFKFN